MIDESNLKRRWYQFSLRTFFVLITAACVGFGCWVHWAREWIRQRHEWLDEFQSQRWLNVGILPVDELPAPHAPGGLWLFGETGVREIVCFSVLGEDDDYSRAAKRLFPEAHVGCIPITAKWKIEDGW